MAKNKQLKYKVKVYPAPIIVEIPVPAKNAEEKSKAFESAVVKLGYESEDVYKVTAK